MPGKKNKIRLLIQESLQIIKPDGSYNASDDLKLDFIKKLLVNDLQSKDKLREKLRTVSEDRLFLIIHIALVYIKNLNPKDIEDAYYAEISKEVSTLKKENHTFIFLVNLEINKPLIEIKINGKKIKWMAYDKFVKSRNYFKDYEVKTKAHFNRIYNKNIFVNKYSVVKIDVEGYDLEYCWDEASTYYEKFLGLVNLSLHINYGSYKLGLYQNYSYSNLTGINIIYQIKYNKLIEERTYLQYSVCETSAFKQDHLNRLKTIQRKINSFKEGDDFRLEMQKYLLIYQRAMKCIDVDLRMLYFWQCLEIFLKGETKKNHTMIVDRVRSIFSDWKIPDNLDLLRKKRDQQVHGDIVTVNDRDVDIIKTISEKVFQYVLFHKKVSNLKTNMYEMLDFINIVEKNQDNPLFTKKNMNSIIKKSGHH